MHACACLSTARTMHDKKASQREKEREGHGHGMPRRPVLPCSDRKAGARGSGFRSKDLGGARVRLCEWRAGLLPCRPVYSAVARWYASTLRVVTYSLMSKGQKGWVGSQEKRRACKCMGWPAIGPMSQAATGRTHIPPAGRRLSCLLLARARAHACMCRALGFCPAS